MTAIDQLPSGFIKISLSCLMLIALAAGVAAQERVSRPEAKPLPSAVEAWANTPETFLRGLKLPVWPMPNDVRIWERNGRSSTRRKLISLLGELPPRPDPGKVRVTAIEDKGDYKLERFEFHNGADTIVPGLLMIPKGVKLPAPTIIALHHYGSSKDDVLINPLHSRPSVNDHIGTLLVKRGFVVAAIDSYFHGERVGSGPAGKTANAAQQELDLFKLNLWLGRNLWGMMIRDQQCLLDYLATRSEIDPSRIGVTGMSMGCALAHWVAALDDRVRVVAGVACFTRYRELLAYAGVKEHSIYYYVPGILKHFDAEALHALIAPRPHLELTGDRDNKAPLAGVQVLEKKLGQFYRLYGKEQDFRSIVYQNTGHEYLPEMKTEVADWFEKHLSPAQASKR